MAAKTGTYTLIASNTLSSNAGTVTLSSIPATYTDLILVTNIIGNAAQQIYFQVNGDTASNYSSTLLEGNGTAASSTRALNQGVGYISIVATTATTNPNFNAVINFMDYSNTSTYKTIINRANNAATGVDAAVSLWRSTSSINSISITSSTSSFAAGSTFKLYGIEAAK
jgi:hypothetical protein